MFEVKLNKLHSLNRSFKDSAVLFRDEKESKLAELKALSIKCQLTTDLNAELKAESQELKNRQLNNEAKI